MLDQVLVVVVGEFGRTPQINPAGGRDHWGNVFSALLAGGGLRHGQDADLLVAAQRLLERNHNRRASEA